MLGISWLAITWPSSSVVSVSRLLVMVRLTLLPAWSMIGFSPRLRAIFLSSRGRRSADFRPAASHTRAIHSLGGGGG